MENRHRPVSMQPHSIQDQLYEFDINGFCVINNALEDSLIVKLNKFWENNLTKHFLHDVDFRWSEEWRNLIDAEEVFPLLDRLFRSRFRLDHMFCADERFVSSGGKMHHQSDMFEEAIFYHVSNNKIFNGLTGVLYALSDMGEHVSHFCCIPGSHRANFEVPAHYRDPKSNRLLHHAYLREGDALVFSEALVHGTYHMPTTRRRRAVFARYTNSFSYYRKPPEHGALTYLPNTPNYSISGPHAIDEKSLTARQRQLVMTPAYVRGRAPIRS